MNHDTISPIANPDAFDEDLSLWHFDFAHGTRLYVWAAHLEDALEEACDWLADNAPGMFTFFDKDDHLRACETNFEKLAVAAAFAPGAHSEDDIDWDAVWAVEERATVDHSIVGHTTYPQFNSTPYLASEDWRVREVR